MFPVNKVSNSFLWISLGFTNSVTCFNVICCYMYICSLVVLNRGIWYTLMLSRAKLELQFPQCAFLTIFFNQKKNHYNFFKLQLNYKNFWSVFSLKQQAILYIFVNHHVEILISTQGVIYDHFLYTENCYLKNFTFFPPNIRMSRKNVNFRDKKNSKKATFIKTKR